MKYNRVKLTPAKNMKTMMMDSNMGSFQCPMLSSVVENPPLGMVVNPWFTAS